MIGLGPIAIGFTIMLGLMFLGFPVAVSMFAIASLGAALFTGLPSVLSFGNLMNRR